MPTNSNSQRQKNLEKYLRAPDLEQIMAFVKELKVKARQFERFYGIPDGTIRQIKQGNRELPPKFWHIVYEKIKPTYGVAYYQKPERKKKLPRQVPQETKKADNTLLNELKNKLG